MKPIGAVRVPSGTIARTRFPVTPQGAISVAQRSRIADALIPVPFPFMIVIGVDSPRASSLRHWLTPLAMNPPSTTRISPLT